MRKIFCLLMDILGLIIDVAEEKPKRRNISIYGAREKLEAGLISREEYNEARNYKETI